MDLTMWHSKWMVTRWSEVNSGLKPHQPGNDKNRAGSMAMWVAPIRVYNHLSRGNPICFLNLCFDAVPCRETVADPNRRWYTFDTLKRNEWSVMWGPGCKKFLLNPVYSSLEIHYRQVVPYLVIVGIQSPISARGFCCILSMWSVRCKRSTRLLFTCI